ncbi:MAG: competence/damage-inducible protein A [Myxococcaceae bacterium]
MARTGAAAVVIGNEVLTEKVRDENGPHLIQRLRERGIALKSFTVVLDEIDAIVDAVTRARSHAQYVFTSGGIGPTHDDVTVRAVSLALGRAVVRLPDMEKLVREHYGSSLTQEALRLAESPEGGYLIPQEGTWYPVLACDDVFMLPGVPQLFRLQLQTVLNRLPGTPMKLVNLYVRLGEPEIAKTIDEVALAMPDVAIGSYPHFDHGLDYRVKLTVESVDAQRASDAVDRIVRGLPKDALVRRDG